MYKIGYPLCLLKSLHPTVLFIQKKEKNTMHTCIRISNQLEMHLKRATKSMANKYGSAIIFDIMIKELANNINIKYYSDVLNMLYVTCVYNIKCKIEYAELF